MIGFCLDNVQRKIVDKKINSADNVMEIRKAPWPDENLANTANIGTRRASQVFEPWKKYRQQAIVWKKKDDD